MINRNILFFILIVSILFGQNRIDVINITNGDIYKGKIIENIQNEFLKLELINGSIKSFEYTEIDTILSEIDLSSNGKFAGIGEIIIRTDPQDAIVTAGGKEFGRSPIIIRNLPKCELPIKVQKNGLFSKELTVSINGVDKQKLNITLDKKTGSAIFDSEPEKAEIFLSGNFIGLTPLSINGLEIGRYKVLYKLNGYLDSEGIVDIKDTESSTYKKSMTSINSINKEKNKFKRRSFTFGGLAILSAVAGGYLYNLSNNEFDSYKNTENSNDAIDKRENVEKFDKLSTVAFGASGAIAIPAIIYLIKSNITKKQLGKEGN